MKGGNPEKENQQYRANEKHKGPVKFYFIIEYWRIDVI